MTEAQARGIAVPERLAVVGFGDLEFAADLHPALTTVRIDGMAIGRQAAQFIVDRAEGRPVEQRVVDIGFSIVERQHDLKDRRGDAGIRLHRALR